jgi:hypothetical protein
MVVHYQVPCFRGLSSGDRRMDSVLYGTSRGGRWGAASCADSPHDGRTVVDTFWEGLPALGRGELVRTYWFFKM